MTSETPTPDALAVEALAEALDAYDATAARLPDRASAIGGVVAAARRVVGGGEVTNRPTPPLPQVRCGDCGTVVDLPDLAERFIRKQARAAAGGAVAVPPDDESVDLVAELRSLGDQAKRLAASPSYAASADVLGGMADTVDAILARHDHRRAVAVPEDRPGESILRGLVEGWKAEAEKSRQRASEAPTPTASKWWAGAADAYDFAIADVRAALGEAS